MDYLEMKKAYLKLFETVIKQDPVRGKYWKEHTIFDDVKRTMRFTGDPKVIEGIYIDAIVINDVR